MRTLSRVTQRPSGVNVWQQPAALVAPRPPARGPRSDPDDVHAGVKAGRLGQDLQFLQRVHEPPNHERVFQVREL